MSFLSHKNEQSLPRIRACSLCPSLGSAQGMKHGVRWPGELGRAFNFPLGVSLGFFICPVDRVGGGQWNGNIKEGLLKESNGTY